MTQTRVEGSRSGAWPCKSTRAGASNDGQQPSELYSWFIAAVVGFRAVSRSGKQAAGFPLPARRIKNKGDSERCRREVNTPLSEHTHNTGVGAIRRARSQKLSRYDTRGGCRPRVGQPSLPAFKPARNSDFWHHSLCGDLRRQSHGKHDADEPAGVEKEIYDHFAGRFQVRPRQGGRRDR